MNSVSVLEMFNKWVDVNRICNWKLLCLEILFYNIGFDGKEFFEFFKLIKIGEVDL